MLFYSKMRWELKDMSFDQLWDLEGREADAAVESIRAGFINHLYKVGAERFVIAIGETNTMEEFDLYSMGVLPMREHLIFDEVWCLEEGFTAEVFSYLKKRRENLKDNPSFIFYVQLSWDPHVRILDNLWEKACGELRHANFGKVLGLYRAAGQQRLIAIVDVKRASDITALGNLPVLRKPAVEKVWALRDYIGFAQDVKNHYKAKI